MSYNKYSNYCITIIRRDLIYDEPGFAINPLTQLPIHDTAPNVLLKSFTLRFEDDVWKKWWVNILYTHREGVEVAENEYEIGTTQIKYTDEVSTYRFTLW